MFSLWSVETVSGVVVVSTSILIWYLFRPVTEKEVLQAIEGERKMFVPPGRELFVASEEWKEVIKDVHVCPPGLEFRMELDTGRSYARKLQ